MFSKEKIYGYSGSVLFLGIGMLKELPEYVSYILVCTGFIGIVITLLWGIFPMIEWSLWPNWSFKSIFPFRILIPLERASFIAYERLKDTSFGEQFELNHELDRIISVRYNQSWDNRKILTYYARFIASNINVYGLELPLSKLSLINNCFDYDAKIDDYGRVRMNKDNQVTHEKLMIEKRQFNKYIDQMMQQHVTR